MGSQTPAEKIRAAKAESSEDDEEVGLWSGTYCNKDITGHALGVGGLSIALLALVVIVAPLRSSAIAWLAVLGFIVLAWGALTGLLMYRKLSRHYELTSQRFKHRAGILTRVSDRIELIDIDDVRVKQGPIQAILGVGTILIRSSDSTHPELTLIGIDRVREIADKIDDARRAERRKRGLHIEAI